eukprot:NODE_4355_length_801_cov_18.529674_g4197_i0.p1 GENE.NODE_4355_length_801_cov_18.529674_g4197_i0~~NODE_4355_length_801_cov_18.529674_g4197_i0.p1  ORF type:complete len:224 (-),score=66.27 NODE_4355_length_801_cov_18.529674_g4197_i0:128-742(-)
MDVQGSEVALSAMLSLGTVDNADALHSIEDLSSKVSSALGVPVEHLEFYQLTSAGEQLPARPCHIGVGVKSDKMTLEYFKFMLAENKRLQTKVEKASEALITLQQHNEQYRKQMVEMRALVPMAGRTDKVSPRDTRVPVQKRLEMNNKLLSAEVEDLRAKLIKSERFKKEVLHTVKDLKKQLAVLTEEILLNDWDMEEDSEAEG